MKLELIFDFVTSDHCGFQCAFHFCISKAYSRTSWPSVSLSDLIGYHVKIRLRSGPVTSDLTTTVVHSYKLLINDVYHKDKTVGGSTSITFV